MTLKAAIYDPYLNTLGGGERYCLTVAEILLKHNYEVDLFWSGQNLISQATKRFNLNLKGLHQVPDIFQVAMDELDLVEDPQSLKQSIPSAPFPQSITHKTKRTLSKIRTTSSYDVIFYLSDGSLPIISGKNNILHAQVPLKINFPFKTQILNRLKITRFHHIVCNSQFTAQIIEPLYHRPTKVIYPPVDVRQFSSLKKEPIIISVGRFDNILNAKKQDVLIKSFESLIQDKQYRSWKLILAGGSAQEPSQNVYLNHLKEIAKGLPIEFFINPDFTTLSQLYSRSSIYWHAAGYGVDQFVHPENTEHFGITVVEAMASGAVPVVVSQGGLPEIVNSGINGFLWSTPEELISQTANLINNPKQLEKFSRQSVLDSLKYSKENFETEMLSLLKA